uniref:Uncharacterized protein n=1 Tax=Kalanchoe fedtschenkoi TaxID=63787 RepID=A0A7N0T660_KALFE
MMESSSSGGSASSPPTLQVLYRSMTMVARSLGFRWGLVMVCLTVSMVFLPLLLPPLPPPPFMLLLFPVAIMAALMFLAFSPAQTYSLNAAVSVAL